MVRKLILGLFALFIAMGVSASLEPAQAQPNTRVCCVDGGRDFFTTQRDCRRQGGRIAPIARCRNDRNERVCCMRGRRDFFTTRNRCRAAGGRVVNRARCERRHEPDFRVD